MDPNLHLALLAVTRDDFLDLIESFPAESLREELLSEPLGESIEDDVALAWSKHHSDRVYEQLGVQGDPEASLVRSLEGLPPCLSSLRVLDLGASRLGDLSLLRTLPGLELVRLGVAPGVDLSPLLDLPALRRVAITGAEGGPAQAVLEQLALRGVMADDPCPDWAALSAPFADRILKLAVLDELHEDQWPDSVPLFDPYALDEGLLARVLRTPLDAAQLASIEQLTWDEGGLAIHHHLYEQWSGEDDTFALRTLAGIEVLSSLRQLACYTRLLPATELDSLVARGVVVYETPFPAQLAEAPHATALPMLGALHLATGSTLPRNFATWSVQERESFLRSIALGSSLRWAGNDGCRGVRWSDSPRAPLPNEPPFPVFPALLCEPGAPLSSVALRSLAGIEPLAEEIEALDLPLSLLDSLDLLALCPVLRILLARITPDADLSVLERMAERLTHVTLLGELTEAQQASLRRLRARHVVVVTAP